MPLHDRHTCLVKQEETLLDSGSTGVYKQIKFYFYDSKQRLDYINVVSINTKDLPNPEMSTWRTTYLYKNDSSRLVLRTTVSGITGDSVKSYTALTYNDSEELANEEIVMMPGNKRFVSIDYKISHSTEKTEIIATAFDKDKQVIGTSWYVYSRNPYLKLYEKNLYANGTEEAFTIPAEAYSNLALSPYAGTKYLLDSDYFYVGEAANKPSMLYNGQGYVLLWQNIAAGGFPVKRFAYYCP